MRSQDEAVFLLLYPLGKSEQASQRTATMHCFGCAGLNGKINTPAGYDQMAAGDETWPHLLPKLAKQVTFCT